MLNHLDLYNFKCFEKLKLPLSPLTLLAGTNASGKSSVLQALVLLHQTMRNHEWSTRLVLNGDSLRLGTVADVVDKVHGRKSFQISLNKDGHLYHWEFEGERNDMSLLVAKVIIDKHVVESPDQLRYLLPKEIDDPNNTFAKKILGLTYITAERVGPREVYPLKDRLVATVVGSNGEHAVSVLHWGRDEKVIDGLVLPDIPNNRLRQAEGWMKKFFPGCSLTLQQVPQANAVILGIRNSNDTDFHRPIHVGFGLTQVFPIIVAALSASKGDILLIENPEVHLHPGGQALMGQFLADVVKTGVQVIIETHSDHVVNGIRRSVKSKTLNSDQITIHFFRPRSDDFPQVESPLMNQSGNIDNWPDGFFDQYDKDMNYFAGWSD